MWLTAGFFDESTDEDTGGLCYAVAGFIGAQLVTATLELRWRDLLTKHNLEYFKASELNAGTGQFQQFRDDPTNYKWRPFSQREKDKFKEIKTDFTDLILSFDKGLYGIGAVVILPDLERLRNEYPHAKTLPLPYFLCTQMCLVEAGAEMFEQNIGQPASKQAFLRPIFDQQEEFSGRAKQAWDGFCKKNPVSARFLLPPHYESENDYLTLQAADDLAFETRKLSMAQQQNLPTRREPIKRHVQSGNLIRIYKLDYDALKIIADAQIGLQPEEIRKRVPTVNSPLTSMRDAMTEPGNGEQSTIREVRRNDREAFDRATQRNQGQTGRRKKGQRKKAEG